jgi:hypothetical protein
LIRRATGEFACDADAVADDVQMRDQRQPLPSRKVPGSISRSKYSP